MEFGLPPFLRLRPRPNDEYGKACEAAMSRDWIPTARLFAEMLKRTLGK